MTDHASSCLPPTALEPFRIAVPQRDVDALRRRLHDTRWPDHMPGSGWTYGADLATMRGLFRPLR